MHSRTDRGFSLLEILLALVALSIGLLALSQATSQQTMARGIIRDQTEATLVASNALELLRLETQWPDTGIRRGQARMGFRDWYWWMEVTQTDNPRIRRVDVFAATNRSERDPVATVSGFFGRTSD